MPPTGPWELGNPIRQLYALRCAELPPRTCRTSLPLTLPRAPRIRPSRPRASPAVVRVASPPRREPRARLPRHHTKQMGERLQARSFTARLLTLTLTLTNPNRTLTLTLTRAL